MSAVALFIITATLSAGEIIGNGVKSENQKGDSYSFYRHTPNSDKPQLLHSKLNSLTSTNKESFYRAGHKGSLRTRGIKTVFGIHERERVMNTQDEYYRIFGKVGDGCSGTLVGPAHVLTAAHCVFNFEYQLFYPNLSYAPAKNGTEEPFGRVAWKAVYVPKGYMASEGPQFDFALIELDENIGNRLGWASIGYNSSNESEGYDIHISGYPGDKEGDEASTLWTVNCPTLRVDEQNGIDHECDTYGGMSGSAIYKVDPLTKEKLIIGVHTLGGFIHPWFRTRSPNSGAYISREVYSVIDGWIAAQFNQSFTQNETNNSGDALNVVYQNNCPGQIQAAITYTDDSGNLVTTELTDLDESQRKFAARIQKGDLFIYVQDLDGNALLKETESDESFKIPGAGRKNFLKVDTSDNDEIAFFIPFCGQA